MLAIVLLLNLLGSAESLVDRIVAVVEKDVITESELLAEARVALAYRIGEQAATGELTEEFLDAFLRDYLVNQVLISVQARRLGTIDVPDAALADAHNQLARNFQSLTAYEAFSVRYGVSKARILEILRRDLRNNTYVAKRMGPRAYEAAHRSAVASQIGEAKPKAGEVNQATALRTWMAELWRNNEVRLLNRSGDLELVLEPRLMKLAWPEDTKRSSESSRD